MNVIQANQAGVFPHAAAAANRSIDHSATEFGRPVIFGELRRPLAGRLHEARGQRLGAVVLCTSWGYEETCAFASFQQLARQLAENGIEALRFDYEGCGNSIGDHTTAAQLDRWVASCAQAVEFMSARTGCPVAVVGLRMGATLAVLASATVSMAATILWDPVVNGRRYLRGVRAMSMMGVAAGPDPGEPGSLIAIGNHLTAATVGAVEGLDLRKIAVAKIDAALIISRPGAPESMRLAAALQGAGVRAGLEEHAGTGEMLDCAAEQSVVPQAILARILGWLRDHPSGSPRRSATTTQPALLDSPDQTWTEEYLSIRPHGLNAVLTLPRHRRYSGVVMMTNNGVARSIGPARAWVEWSRAWADAGIASLRLDLGGLGDSPAHPGRARQVNYPIEAIDDITAAVTELKRRGLGPVVAVGLCSGAFLSLDAAASDAGLGALVCINAQTFHLPDRPGSVTRHRRAAPAAHPWVQRFLENTRVGRRLGRSLPYPAWWLLDLLGLHPSPLRGAERARAKARVLLIYGDTNLGYQRLQQRARGDLRRWHKRGAVAAIQGLDHSMFAPQMRERVEGTVRKFLLETLPALGSEVAVATPPQRAPLPQLQWLAGRSVARVQVI